VTYEDKDTLVVEPGEADIQENEQVVEVYRNSGGFTDAELADIRKRLYDGSRKILHIKHVETFPESPCDPSTDAVQRFVCTDADGAEVNDELYRVIDVPVKWYKNGERSKVYAYTATDRWADADLTFECYSAGTTGDMFVFETVDMANEAEHLIADLRAQMSADLTDPEEWVEPEETPEMIELRQQIERLSAIPVTVQRTVQRTDDGTELVVVLSKVE
jgi:hypothetical protein